MFRCSKCNQISVSGEPAVRVVTKTRPRIYPYREQAMRRGRGLSLKWVADRGGSGTEIVHEELRHAACTVYEQDTNYERI